MKIKDFYLKKCHNWLRKNGWLPTMLKLYQTQMKFIDIIKINNKEFSLLDHGIESNSIVFNYMFSIDLLLFLVLTISKTSVFLHLHYSKW